MSTSPLDKVTLSGSDLAFIDSPFGGIRPGFQKEVTIVFTNGKSDHVWACVSQCVWPHPCKLGSRRCPQSPMFGSLPRRSLRHTLSK